MKITVKNSTMVTPATETPEHGLWISNLDYVVSRVHQPSVHFYRPDGTDNFFDAEVMKKSLSKALVPFYPVAGRLRLGEDGRLEINCNGQGGLFVEASAEGMMDDLGDFAPNMELRQLVPRVDYSDDVSSYPLLVVQVTVFKCGGVGLGVGLLHTLGDGAAALHFMNSWSDLARGMDVDVRPIIDRTLLRARDPPQPTFQHPQFQPAPLLKTQISGEQSQTTSTKAAIFKFSADQLAKLKDKVKQGDGSCSKCTTFECLAAHLWRCVSLARGLDDDQKTRFHIPIDGRSRLRPEIPKQYFGNVVIQAVPVETVGELLSRPLHYTASKIREAVLQVDDKYLRSQLDYLELQPDLDEIVTDHRIFSSPNLKISSWARFPFYDADFGWGKPVFVGHAGIAFDGSGYLLPAPVDDGSLSLAIALQPDVLRAFGKLIYDI